MYFDVLSIKNRTKYPGISNFTSSITIFQTVIKYLCDFQFEEIKKMKYYRDCSDICGREKLFTLKDFSFRTKLFSENKIELGNGSEYLNAKYFYIKIFEKFRKQKKISLDNHELYFNSLLQLYFENIENAGDDRLNVIAEIICQLYDLIAGYLERIEKNNILSSDDIKIMNIILFAPIMADNQYIYINRIIDSFDDNSENRNDNANDIIISKDRLIIKYAYVRKIDGKIVENSVEFKKLIYII